MILNNRQNGVLSGKYFAILKIYEGLENPMWSVNKHLAKKIYFHAKKLDYANEKLFELMIRHQKGITYFDNERDLQIMISKQFVIVKNKNVIEIKVDINCDTENWLLRSIPDKSLQERVFYLCFCQNCK